MADDLKKMYRTIVEDHFPSKMEISFIEGQDRPNLILTKKYYGPLMMFKKACDMVKIPDKKPPFTN